MCVYARAIWHTWSSEDNYVELVLSIFTWVPGIKPMTPDSCSKCLYSHSHGSHSLLFSYISI